MQHLLLIVLVVLAFALWFAATWPIAWGERTARGLFLAASVVWAWSAVAGK
jgi:hypothetical protein